MSDCLDDVVADIFGRDKIRAGNGTKTILAWPTLTVNDQRDALIWDRIENCLVAFFSKP